MFNELIPKIQIKPSSNTVYSYSEEEIKQNDSPVKADLRATELNNTPNESIPKTQIKPSSNTVYSYSKQEIKQDDSSIIKSDYSVTPQLINQPTPDEIVRREISHASPEEKVKILETAFRQDRFRELEDEQINALQSILEQSRREVNLANSAYTQGKLSNRKTNVFIVAAVFIAIATGSFFVVTHQATLNHQPNPTIPSNNYK